MANAHHIRHPLHPLLHLSGWRLLEFEGITDVLQNAHMRVESITLKDHANVAVFGRDLVDDTPVKADLAGRGLVDAGHHQQGRRLATAGGAEKGDELPILNRKGNAIRARYIAPTLSQVVQFNTHSILPTLG